MIKQHITPESVFEVLKSAHIIGLLAKTIDVELQQRVVDTKFKNSNTNNHVRRIKEASETIQKDLAYQFKVKDYDAMTYDYALQFHRLVDYFSEKSADQLRDFMDGVEKLKED